MDNAKQCITDYEFIVKNIQKTTAGTAFKYDLYLNKMGKSTSALRPQFSKVLKTLLNKVLKYIFKFFCSMIEKFL